MSTTASFRVFTDGVEGFLAATHNWTSDNTWSCSDKAFSATQGTWFWSKEEGKASFFGVPAGDSKLRFIFYLEGIAYDSASGMPFSEGQSGDGLVKTTGGRLPDFFSWECSVVG